MEKDNELKGLGNSLDFGARMYDSRLGRFLSLDPFMGVYPSESNYTFAGNSPLLFIDKNGDKKFIYKYVIDLRNQTITIPTHAIVKDGLTSVHRRIYNSAKEYWSWYDYTVNQITIIDKNGKEKTYETSPYNINYSKERAWTALPSETMARAAVGEYWTDYFQPEKEYEGETFGGYNFVFRGDTRGIPNYGADNKYNRTGDATTQIIYIEDLLSVLGIGGGAMNVNKPAKGIELFKYVNDVAQTATNAQELSPIKVKKKFLQCETCERYQYESDKSNIDDTLNKGITTENTQKIKTSTFHE